MNKKLWEEIFEEPQDSHVNRRSFLDILATPGADLVMGNRSSPPRESWLSGLANSLFSGGFLGVPWSDDSAQGAMRMHPADSLRGRTRTVPEVGGVVSELFKDIKDAEEAPALVDSILGGVDSVMSSFSLPPRGDVSSVGEAGRRLSEAVNSVSGVTPNTMDPLGIPTDMPNAPTETSAVEESMWANKAIQDLLGQREAILDEAAELKPKGLSLMDLVSAALPALFTKAFGSSKDAGAFAMGSVKALDSLKEKDKEEFQQELMKKKFQLDKISLPLNLAIEEAKLDRELKEQENKEAREYRYAIGKIKAETVGRTMQERYKLELENAMGSALRPVEELNYENGLGDNVTLIHNENGLSKPFKDKLDTTSVREVNQYSNLYEHALDRMQEYIAINARLGGYSLTSGKYFFGANVSESTLRARGDTVKRELTDYLTALTAPKKEGRTAVVTRADIKDDIPDLGSASLIGYVFTGGTPAETNHKLLVSIMRQLAQDSESTIKNMGPFLPRKDSSLSKSISQSFAFSPMLSEDITTLYDSASKNYVRGQIVEHPKFGRSVYLGNNRYAKPYGE